MGNRPYYDTENHCWAVDMEYGHEEGCIEYVMSEFVKGGLYFPFKYGAEEEKGRHSHTFDGLIQDVMRNPQEFSIEGYEEYYSDQELEFLTKIKNKLIEVEKDMTIIKYKWFRAEVQYDEEHRVYRGRVIDIPDDWTFEGATMEAVQEAFRDCIENS